MSDYKPKPYDAKRLDNLKGLSAESVQAHYKLYEAYCAKFNESMDRLTAADKEKSNQVYSDYRAASLGATFAVGGIKNHEIYFAHLGGDGKPVEGKFKEQAEKFFGSWEAYLADLKAAGMAGRGWVWTVWDDDFRSIYNCIGDAQDTFPIWNGHPVVALDVYEHAYIADFSTARPAYIDCFLENMDWRVVEDSFAKIHG